eukprot:gene4008-6215_t
MGVISRGVLPVGPGIGHTVFLPCEELRPGELVNWWWTATPLLGGGPSPVQRRTILIPHEDPPQVLSLAAAPSCDRPGINCRVETDFAGTLHYIVCAPGTGHLFLPAELKEIADRGPAGPLPEHAARVLAAGRCPIFSAGAHMFTVTFPVPPEHQHTAHCPEGALAPGGRYEVFFLADSRAADNPATRVSRAYPVTLPLEFLHADVADASPPRGDAASAAGS